MKAVPVILVTLASILGLGLGMDPELQQILKEVQDNLKSRLATITSKNILKYNDPCDFNLEKKRIQVNSLFMESMQLPVSSPLDKAFFTDIEDLSKAKGDFCNAFDHLECSTAGRCVCDNAHHSLGFEMNFIRDGNSCRLARSSICAPQDLFEERRTLDIQLTDLSKMIQTECASPARCVVRSNNRKACTRHTFKKEIVRLASDHGQSSGLDGLQFTLKKIKEGVCVCSGISLTPSKIPLIVVGISFTLKYVF